MHLLQVKRKHPHSADSIFYNNKRYTKCNKISFICKKLKIKTTALNDLTTKQILNLFRFTFIPSNTTLPRCFTLLVSFSFTFFCSVFIFLFFCFSISSRSSSTFHSFRSLWKSSLRAHVYIQTMQFVVFQRSCQYKTHLWTLDKWWDRRLFIVVEISTAFSTSTTAPLPTP